MNKYFNNKKILVTGASGSIGSALVLRLLKMNCKVIRAFSNDENGLYELSEKIRKFNSNANLKYQMEKNKIRYIYGDVSDKERCLTASENIDIVIHAAAMKHVPFCEYNPFEATKTNVIGTENMVNASLTNNVSRFLLVSTDKVVSPTSCLGATKLLAERVVINSKNIKGSKKTIFACARFGNVIGTRGSIVPYLAMQIKNNQNLTVTDPNMTRYFMTIDNATEVLIESIKEMKGGEIFIPRKLKLFKVMDLANSLKKIYNKNKLKIKIIGKRPGEKVFENLVSETEIENIKLTKKFYTIKDSIKNNNKKISSINKALGQYKIMSQKEILDFFKNKYLVLFNKNFSGF